MTHNRNSPDRQFPLLSKAPLARSPSCVLFKTRKISSVHTLTYTRARTQVARSGHTVRREKCYAQWDGKRRVNTWDTLSYPSVMWRSRDCSRVISGVRGRESWRRGDYYSIQIVKNEIETFYEFLSLCLVTIIEIILYHRMCILCTIETIFE